MEQIQLNKEKVLAEMARANMSRADVARHFKVTRQAVDYWLKNKPPKAAVRFSTLFHLPAKDFIK